MATNDNSREQFRTELEFASAPTRETLRLNYEGAIKFAEAGIKSSFALNGGGLIALPAFIALFKIDPKFASVWIIAAGTMFIVGLISAAVTSFLGYLSAMAGVHSLENRSAATMAKYAAIFKQLQATQPVNLLELEGHIDTLMRRSVRLRKCAVAAGTTSLIAFLGGAVISYWVLILFRP